MGFPDFNCVELRSCARTPSVNLSVSLVARRSDALSVLRENGARVVLFIRNLYLGDASTALNVPYL